MGNGRISAKQAEILEYIKAQILEKGYPPAVREICSAVHLKSTSSVLPVDILFLKFVLLCILIF